MLTQIPYTRNSEMGEDTRQSTGPQATYHTYKPTIHLIVQKKEQNTRMKVTEMRKNWNTCTHLFHYYH